ncbi:signal peptidase II [Thiomicrorhabdus sp. ZW0627]|uniref:signal peptidase II n=1 Tax=Thiomicrorhabdus sp. ZW0627 TaxID=3039774 RepID=UPI00243695C1|nr:signal peptidase II [Thiomicrorhabdus sp. ZW0627]MDG6774751.1 signal peptidase II [Thiomicrorhabdus sp. ZW0627]
MPDQPSVMPTSKSAVRTLWFTLLVIALDQLTKVWAVSALEFAVPVPVMPNLNWTLNYNHGAAFSFLADMGGWQRWFFTALAVGISAILYVWLKKLPNKLNVETIGINMVLGGAIGNVIDRVFEGKVTDFIDFYIGTWHYATFNVADVAISVGAALLVLSELILKPRAEKKAKAASSANTEADK